MFDARQDPRGEDPIRPISTAATTRIRGEKQHRRRADARDSTARGATGSDGCPRRRRVLRSGSGERRGRVKLGRRRRRRRSSSERDVFALGSARLSVLPSFTREDAGGFAAAQVGPRTRRDERRDIVLLQCATRRCESVARTQLVDDEFHALGEVGPQLGQARSEELGEAGKDKR